MLQSALHFCKENYSNDREQERENTKETISTA